MDMPSNAELARAVSDGEEIAWFRKKERDRIVQQLLAWADQQTSDTIIGYISLLPIVI